MQASCTTKTVTMQHAGGVKDEPVPSPEPVLSDSPSQSSSRDAADTDNERTR